VRSRQARLAATALLVALGVAACGDDGGSGSGTELSGTISGDGSSTVFPIMEAVAEEFGKLHTGVKIQVGESGTGGGFEKFCKGETDFSNASRAIKAEEKAKCDANSVQFTEFKIASDGLSVVTHKDLKIDCLTVDELKKTFVAGSPVDQAGEIKAGLPATPIKIFMPGSDSGTYDFFGEEILGKDVKFRTDPIVTTSEDDNILVQGIAGTKGGGIGFFGFSYYEASADQLNLVAVDEGKGCVKPSKDTILDGAYSPLSRPLYVYVKNSVLTRPEVKEMMKFILGTEGRALIEEVDYVQLPAAEYDASLAKLG
jgi:phosphate transport system substrate-binding protein